jgi:hypothetical protein
MQRESLKKQENSSVGATDILKGEYCTSKKKQIRWKEPLKLVEL